MSGSPSLRAPAGGLWLCGALGLLGSCTGCLSGRIDFVPSADGGCPAEFPVRCLDGHCYRTQPERCMGGPAGGGQGSGGGAGAGGQGAGGGGTAGDGGRPCGMICKGVGWSCGRLGECECGTCAAGDACDAGECAPDLDFSLTDDSGARWVWENPLPQGNTLRAVWAAHDGGHAWAVGDHGTVLRFNGALWSTVRIATTANLRAVGGSSPFDVWAVGDEGVVLRFDGSAWKPQPSAPARLHAVWVGPEVHVLGEATDGGNGAAFRWQAGSWVPVPVGGAQVPFAVAEHAGELFAVGGGRNSSGAWRLDADAGWVVLPFALPPPITLGTVANGLSVLVSYHGQLVAIGRDWLPLAFTDAGLAPLPELAGTMYRLPNGTYGVSSATVDSAGSLLYGTGYHLVYRLLPDGGAEDLGNCHDTSACFSDQLVLGMQRLSDGTLISVGQGGRIYRAFPNGKWVRDGSGHVIQLRSIVIASDGGAWTVGGDGLSSGHTLLRDGGSFVRSDFQPYAWNSVELSASGQVATAGVLGTYQFDRGFAVCAGCGDLLALRSAGDEWWAVGVDGGVRLRLDGGRSPMGDLRGHFTSITRAGAPMAIEVSGEVHLFDGGSFAPLLSVGSGGAHPWVLTQNGRSWLAAGQGLWMRGSFGPAVPLRPAQTLYFGACSDDADVYWAVGERGLVTRCENNRCLDVHPTHQTLRAVNGAAGLGIWVVGDEGAVLRRVP